MNGIVSTEDEKACLITKDNIIKKTNSLLNNIIGFDVALGLCIEDLWEAIKLRRDEKGYNITPKNLPLKYVDIEVYESLDKTEKTYVFREKYNNKQKEVANDYLYQEANLKMENMLVKQEEFFANMSHELKTPLNVIYATIQLVDMFCRNGSLDDKKDRMDKYVKIIIQNCYRLSKLINNIVDFSKIEAGYYQLNKTNQNIVNVLEEIVMSIVQYSESKGINIIFDTNVEDKIIACDTEKIERIVLNLMSNAIKFSDKGSDILIEFFDKGDFVEISVTDSGTGISRDQIKTIFERFKQCDRSLSRNAEGTGIGLSLVKALVELHDGSIEVESELGQGSKFTVKLPSERVEETKTLTRGDMMRDNSHILSIELSDINK